MAKRAIRRTKKGTSSVPAARTRKTGPVIRLTAKQNSILAKAGCAVEIQDLSGKTIGHLLHTPELTRFYTPAELANLLRRAANPRPGRNLREILRDAEAKAKAFHEWQSTAQARTDP